MLYVMCIHPMHAVSNSIIHTKVYHVWRDSTVALWIHDVANSLASFPIWPPLCL